jgi:Cu/Ag efflux protein CusF
MRYVTAVGTALLLVGTFAGGALGQAPPRPEAKTPETLQGQVVKVDMDAGKVTVRAGDGTIHEFEASRETLQDLKPGDRIEAKRRAAPAR